MKKSVLLIVGISCIYNGCCTAGSDPIPRCPQSGIYLKNNAPRQESFAVNFTDGSNKLYSVLALDSVCIRTTQGHKVLSITVNPWPSGNNIDDTALVNDGNGAGTNNNRVKRHSKTFTQCRSGTRTYKLPSTYGIFRTINYDGYTIQCWQASPDLTPWTKETPAKPIIFHAKKARRR